MSESPPSQARHRAFWEFLDGKRPAPPAAAMLGWELSWVAPERGEIEVFFDAHQGFTNPMGNVQGGFLAAMLDDTFGPALAATLADAEFAPTLELKVSFPRPPPRAGSPAPAGSCTAAAPSRSWPGSCGTRQARCWRRRPRPPASSGPPRSGDLGRGRR